MLFQPLDEKRFAGVYAEGKLHRDMPKEITATWRFCDYLSDRDILYASLYCGGKSLTEVCPPSLFNRWNEASKRVSAHISACQLSKMDLNSYTFLELIPAKLLVEFLDLKNEITEHVLQEYPKPKNYSFLCNLERLVAKIRARKLNINLTTLRPHLTTVRARSAYKRIQAAKPIIDYDVWGTKTGRLTVKKGAFPILTLDKQFRSAIEPSNDLFLELDFNAAELRTVLALLGKEQPTGDIHEWNIKNVFSGSETREQAKKKVFAWLYNPERRDSELDNMYDRSAVVQEYFSGSEVNTFFHRSIPADSKHALNYIIQSTTSDLLLKRAIEIDKMLDEKRSKVAFTLHDSLIIDFSIKDKKMIPDIIKTFSETDLGKYVVNVSAGKNFGHMRALNL